MDSCFTAFAHICELYIRPHADYKIREYMFSVYKATIQGKSGIVEVWGGAHANEIWVIERGTKKETCIATDWHLLPMVTSDDGRMSLDEALSKAFALAGVQTKLGI